MKYRVIASARKIGAIGIRGFMVRDVEADSPEQAILKCYETHEHIHDPRVIDLATGKEVKYAG